MSAVALSDRKKRILRAIVEAYIATAEPVGSKAVAELAGLDVSTATIRNEMADLTEQGYLEQPHTSAGRVPSAAGYRLYVNELMDRQQLTIQETQRINDALNLKMEELDRVIDRAGKVLSQISDYPVFTLAAGSGNATIQRMDLLMVEEHAFIAVVMTDSSVVKNKLFHVEQPLSEPQLQMLSTILNSSFLGLTLEETNKVGLELFRYLPEYGAYYTAHTDFGGDMFTIYSGRILEDGSIELTYDGINWQTGIRVAVLEEAERPYAPRLYYQVKSNLRADWEELSPAPSGSAPADMSATAGWT